MTGNWDVRAAMEQVHRNNNDHDDTFGQLVRGMDSIGLHRSGESTLWGLANAGWHEHKHGPPLREGVAVVKQKPRKRPTTDSQELQVLKGCNRTGKVFTRNPLKNKKVPQHGLEPWTTSYH